MFICFLSVPNGMSGDVCSDWEAQCQFDRSWSNSKFELGFLWKKTGKKFWITSFWVFLSCSSDDAVDKFEAALFKQYRKTTKVCATEIAQSQPCNRRVNMYAKITDRWPKSVVWFGFRNRHSQSGCKLISCWGVFICFGAWKVQSK